MGTSQGAAALSMTKLAAPKTTRNKQRRGKGSQGRSRGEGVSGSKLSSSGSLWNLLDDTSNPGASQDPSASQDAERVGVSPASKKKQKDSRLLAGVKRRPAAATRPAAKA